MTSRIILILILATARLSEGEIVTTIARFRMMPRFQRLNAMIKQARLAAPDHHIAMLQQQPLQRVAALQAAKLKDGRQAQRDRDNRRPQILFIFILMQRQFCAVTIAVNQTGVGRKLRIAAGGAAASASS